MACGRPVVATAHGGIEEIVRPGETGLLVPPGDAQALARAVGQLLGDPAARRRLGRAGQEAVARYRPEALVAGTLEVYREALAAAGR